MSVNVIHVPMTPNLSKEKIPITRLLMVKHLRYDYKKHIKQINL